jgi:CBS-domain-containing membrane protein
MMDKLKVHHLPVLDGGRLVGVITDFDLITETKRGHRAEVGRHLYLARRRPRCAQPAHPAPLTVSGRQ